MITAREAKEKAIKNRKEIFRLKKEVYNLKRDEILKEVFSEINKAVEGGYEYCVMNFPKMVDDITCNEEFYADLLSLGYDAGRTSFSKNAEFKISWSNPTKVRRVKQ